MIGLAPCSVCEAPFGCEPGMCVAGRERARGLTRGLPPEAVGLLDQAEAVVAELRDEETADNEKGWPEVVDTGSTGDRLVDAVIALTEEMDQGGDLEVHYAAITQAVLETAPDAEFFARAAARLRGLAKVAYEGPDHARVFWRAATALDECVTALGDT